MTALGEGAAFVVASNQSEDHLVRKAVNLFTFLGGAQKILGKPVRVVDGFEEVLWFSDLPDHSSVWRHQSGAGLDAEEPLLEVERVPRIEPPSVPDMLGGWVSGPLDEVDEQPGLRDAIFTHEPDKP